MSIAVCLSQLKYWPLLLVVSVARYVSIARSFIGHQFFCKLPVGLCSKTRLGTFLIYCPLDHLAIANSSSDLCSYNSTEPFGMQISGVKCLDWFQPLPIRLFAVIYGSGTLLNRVRIWFNTIFLIY